MIININHTGDDQTLSRPWRGGGVRLSGFGFLVAAASMGRFGQGLKAVEAVAKPLP